MSRFVVTFADERRRQLPVDQWEHTADQRIVFTVKGARTDPFPVDEIHSIHERVWPPLAPPAPTDDASPAPRPVGRAAEAGGHAAGVVGEVDARGAGSPSGPPASNLITDHAFTLHPLHPLVGQRCGYFALRRGPATRDWEWGRCWEPPQAHESSVGSSAPLGQSKRAQAADNAAPTAPTGERAHG